MQLESGSDGAARHAAPWAELTGYDQIALDDHPRDRSTPNAIIPLNVAEPRQHPRASSDDDVIEVPCVVNANGPHAAARRRACPTQVRDLVIAGEGVRARAPCRRR